MYIYKTRRTTQEENFGIPLETAAKPPGAVGQILVQGRRRGA